MTIEGKEGKVLRSTSVGDVGLESQQTTREHEVAVAHPDMSIGIGAEDNAKTTTTSAGKTMALRTVSVGEVGLEYDQNHWTSDRDGVPIDLGTGATGQPKGLPALRRQVDVVKTTSKDVVRDQERILELKQQACTGNELQPSQSTVDRGQKLVANYVLRGNSNQLSQRTASSPFDPSTSGIWEELLQPAGMQTERQPGAFAERPGWRATDSSSLDADMSWGDGASESPSPLPPLDGLAEASPVILPTETAEPVGSQELHDLETTRRKGRVSSLAMVLGVGGCIIIIIVVVLVVVLVDTNNTANSQKTTGDDTTENSPWEWDLPFSIPNETLFAIQTEQISENGTISSPQYQAYQWMKNDPYLDSYSAERLKQRFALATFYYATGGEHWDYQGGGTIEFAIDRTKGLEFVNLTSEPWLSYQHSECEWLSAASEEARMGAPSCSNDTDTLVNLALVNGLKGTLPEEVFWLTSLETLDLRRNAIKGTISTSIGKLTNLWKIGFHKNQFSGGLPSEIGLLSSLAWLGLLVNPFLTGQLPSEIWQLSSLENLKISDTGLSGMLASDIGVRMRNLTQLGLSRSNLSGNLPSTLGLLTKLTEMALHENRFTSFIPSELGLATNLAKFYATDNQLTGTLPSELSQLKFVNLQDNIGLTGTLPSEWAGASVLKLQGTSITGTIPMEACGMRKLEFDCGSSLCGCESCPCSNFTTT